MKNVMLFAVVALGVSNLARAEEFSVGHFPAHILGKGSIFRLQLPTYRQLPRVIGDEKMVTFYIQDQNFYPESSEHELSRHKPFCRLYISKEQSVRPAAQFYGASLDLKLIEDSHGSGGGWKAHGVVDGKATVTPLASFGFDFEGPSEDQNGHVYCTFPSSADNSLGAISHYLGGSYSFSGKLKMKKLTKVEQPTTKQSSTLSEILPK
jgi:hypothetical protein